MINPVALKVNGINYPIEGSLKLFFTLDNYGQRTSEHCLFFWPKIGQRVTTNGNVYEGAY